LQENKLPQRYSTTTDISYCEALNSHREMKLAFSLLAFPLWAQVNAV